MIIPLFVCRALLVIAPRPNRDLSDPPVAPILTFVSLFVDNVWRLFQQFISDAERLKRGNVLPVRRAALVVQKRITAPGQNTARLFYYSKNSSDSESYIVLTFKSDCGQQSWTFPVHPLSPSIHAVPPVNS